MNRCATSDDGGARRRSVRDVRVDGAMATCRAAAVGGQSADAGGCGAVTVVSCVVVRAAAVVWTQ